MNKTMPTPANVDQFIADISNPQRQADTRAAVALVHGVTSEAPVMWGPSIIGFGTIHYKYASGREGDTPVIGLSPRAAALTWYGLVFYNEEPLLEELGSYTRGKGCVYIKDLSKIDQTVLTQLIRQAWTKPRVLEQRPD